MKCQNCGANCDDSTQFCPICGNPMPTGSVNLNKDDASTNMGGYYQQSAAPSSGNSQNPYQQNPYQQNQGYNYYQNSNINPNEIREENLPEALKPLSPWAYLGYYCLFTMIPCAGLILAFVFAFSNGTSDNINRRNFARFYLLMLAIGIVLSIFFVIIMTMLGFSFSNYYNYYGNQIVY